MTILERVNLRYMKKLFSSAEGRAHVLAQAADGESSGEAAIFERTIAQVDDPELKRVIRKHQEDELRHERLFRERLAAQNAPYTLPDDLRLVARVDREAGGLIDRPIRDAYGVLEAYSLLQALEERAVFSFGMFIAALKDVDPESARVIEEVLEDEKRHLKYCVAVAKKYARDEQERLAVLARMRAAEARAFKANQLANMDYTLSKGWIGGAVETALWRVVRFVARPLPPLEAAPQQAAV
ncbi:MAG: ferritin-like domain-containing protein [Myxococcales bacterium]